uniref:Uncharacterized protein n=1 Tax=Setaria italica TaxID=4555 RepID=K3YBH7_SETIT
MKIVMCAVLMLVIISNCTAEMPTMMAAEKEHAELAEETKVSAKHVNKKLYHRTNGERNCTYPSCN